MSSNTKKCVRLREEPIMRCKACKKIFAVSDRFCDICGEELEPGRAIVFANFGRSGMTSLLYKLSDGVSLNVKTKDAFGRMNIPLQKGLSYAKPKK